MWDGYVVLEFSWSQRVVLDCPITGNAIYIISGDWKELARHSKFHLWSEYSENCTRVLYTGNWLWRVKAALQR
jgi:hypothetical protein